ncbi:RNA helicase [Kosakonia sp. MH5]|uniref:RNA helicase n=1 Tax=Kosakonia sp. MH5 TaxID=2202822 RepID=UPI0013752193|nr:RNA helicase [Kosakonia sp. MH5]NCF03863.1 RNA helicase [Kosakonia sp. MH5]
MAKTLQINETQAKKEATDDETQICGIIMPIAKTDGYPEKHWADVYDILCEVATQAEFNPNLVSFDDDVGIIHKRIVQNIYSNPIVICDISSRNANVMLELGMRLAFDKPTIIIKDDKTPYSFDIAAIEHLEYPSDLRYQLINEFKQKLHTKIVETYRRSKGDGNYTTFLKHFGTFKVAKIDEKEVSGGEYLMAEMKELKSLVMNAVVSNKTNRSATHEVINNKDRARRIYKYTPEDAGDKNISLPELSDFLKSYGVDVFSIGPVRDDGSFFVGYDTTFSLINRPDELKSLIDTYIENRLL